MYTYLFRVDAVFSIPGRGHMLAPGIARRHTVHAGATIELRQPDGTILRTTILGLEMIGTIRDSTGTFISPILIDYALAVAPGTEVWLLDEHHATSRSD